MKRFFAPLALAVILFSAPFFAFAAHNALKTNVFDPTTLDGPILICVGSPTVAGGGITNPCQNLCDLVAQAANMIYYAIAVVLWIITPIMVTVGGLFIMLGGANPEMIGRGKKMITNTVWSVVIVLCAWLIVFAFVNAFGNLGKFVGGFGGANGQAACSV
jgi:hypothetical protein